MTQRYLTLVNNSSSATSLVVLQNANDRDSVAWLAKYAYPGTQIRFSWDDTDLCFVWAGADHLSPGVVVEVSQIIPAQLDQGNQIDLAYDARNRTFDFRNQRSGGNPGTLTIRTDASVPSNAVALGIGMAEQPTAVVQAQPNMNYTFMPRTTYYIAFGAIEQGEIVDTESLFCQPIEFPPNVVALTATLGPNLQWTVTSNILSTATTEA